MKVLHQLVSLSPPTTIIQSSLKMAVTCPMYNCQDAVSEADLREHLLSHQGIHLYGHRDLETEVHFFIPKEGSGQALLLVEKFGEVFLVSVYWNDKFTTAFLSHLTDAHFPAQYRLTHRTANGVSSFVGSLIDRSLNIQYIQENLPVLTLQTPFIRTLRSDNGLVINLQVI